MNQKLSYKIKDRGSSRYSIITFEEFLDYGRKNTSLPLIEGTSYPSNFQFYGYTANYKDNGVYTITTSYGPIDFDKEMLAYRNVEGFGGLNFVHNDVFYGNYEVDCANSEFEIPYWIQDNGDVGASLRIENTEDEAYSNDENQSQSFAESTAGTIIISIVNGKLSIKQR